MRGNTESYLRDLDMNLNCLAILHLPSPMCRLGVTKDEHVLLTPPILDPLIPTPSLLLYPPFTSATKTFFC